MPTRREFVKLTCGFCAAITGVGLASTFLQSCTSIPVIKAGPENQKISVAESSFGDQKLLLVRSEKLENDILLVKITEQSTLKYHAILMRCSHQDQPLTAQGTKIHCATHGSEFDLNGNVVKEPDIFPLTKYKVEAKDGMLIIDLKF